MKDVFKKILIFPLRIVARIQVKYRKKYERILAKECFREVQFVGSNVRLEGPGIIHEPSNLRVGNHVFIGRNFFIRSAGGVVIGNYSHISRNVVIHTANHNINGELLPYDNTEILKPVNIGEYVWIGMNVCILPGVTIGDGAVIGMGCIISKDVLPGEIVVGASQRVVRRRDPKHTIRLVESNSFLKIKSCNENDCK